MTRVLLIKKNEASNSGTTRYIPSCSSFGPSCANLSIFTFGGLTAHVSDVGNQSQRSHLWPWTRAKPINSYRSESRTHEKDASTNYTCKFWVVPGNDCPLDSQISKLK